MAASLPVREKPDCSHLAPMEGYTVSSSGADCKSAALMARVVQPHLLPPIVEVVKRKGKPSQRIIRKKVRHEFKSHLQHHEVFGTQVVPPNKINLATLKHANCRIKVSLQIIGEGVWQYRLYDHLDQ